MRALSLVDAAGFALLSHDVVAVGDAELDAPTPCAGWNVADLIDHMNMRHQALLVPAFAAVDSSVDRRDAFALIAARYVIHMSTAGEFIESPWRGRVPTDWLLSVHIVDMLTHRWDLLSALGRPCPVPRRLTDIALPIARRITPRDSPLTGAADTYRAPLPEPAVDSPMDRIVALLGRDPNYRPR